MASGAEPGGPPPDAAAIREARARFDEGLASVKKNNFDLARVSFQQAYAVIHSLDILWNLALAEEKSGHIVEALRHYRQFDKEASSEIDRVPVKKHIEELSAVTGHIAVAGVDGASVRIDGEQMGKLPFAQPVDVAAGHHELEAVVGTARQTVGVDAPAGQIATASFSEAMAPSPPTGGATSVGALPPQPPTTPPGADQGSTGGGPSTAKIVTVVAIGGVALVSAGLGIGFALKSQGDANDAATQRGTNGDNSCQGVTSTRCTNLANDVNAQKNDNALSIGGYVAGGVLAAGAVATWFLWPNAAPSASPASTAAATGSRGTGRTTGIIVPVVSPGMTGLSWSGSF